MTSGDKANRNNPGNQGKFMDKTMKIYQENQERANKLVDEALSRKDGLVTGVPAEVRNKLAAKKAENTKKIKEQEARSAKEKKEAEEVAKIESKKKIEKNKEHALSKEGKIIDILFNAVITVPSS